MYDSVCVLDVNECDHLDGGCSYTCVNTDGSFHCDCPLGYDLDFDQRTCLGKIRY